MRHEIDFWWVTRPKRKLEPVQLILSQVTSRFLNDVWQGDRKLHLAFEEQLEQSNIKRQGVRRDKTGGGGRTYIAWLKSLGLIFTESSTKRMCLTLAGEALLGNNSPVEVLSNQVIKYQFPSSFSTLNSPVNIRFKVHPFVFLLRLLVDSQIGYLTNDEIANIVIIHGENDSERCLNQVKEKILNYRAHGSASLESDFVQRYLDGNPASTKLDDTANTFINWIEFTRLAHRENGKLVITEDNLDRVHNILNNPPKFIPDWDNEEKYQRRYGLDLHHQKDTRNLTLTSTITAAQIAEATIRMQFLDVSSQELILDIDRNVIEAICKKTAYPAEVVEKNLHKLFPNGGLKVFMPKLYEMAYAGREKATEFEKATVEIFSKEFKYEARHVGPIGLTPDVLVISNEAGYCGIIDNKAYAQYSITNDHHNRMVQNYIKGLRNYYSGNSPLKFFSYIAGGFSKNIDSQLSKIATETNICGSALNVENFIRLIEKNKTSHLSHEQLGALFSCGKQITALDI